MVQNHKIKVCDTIMGSGKSSAAITLMNNDPSGRYLFVTPYLDEVNRIIASCPEKRFKQPIDSSRKSKLKDLHRLLEGRLCIRKDGQGNEPGLLEVAHREPSQTIIPRRWVRRYLA